MKRVIPWLLGVLSLVLLTACGQTVSDPKVDNWQKYQKEQSIFLLKSHGNKGIIKTNRDGLFLLEFLPIVYFRITHSLTASRQKDETKDT